MTVAEPREIWHEDMGPMLWWKFPVDEAPWVGTPHDSDWPGYHTHFTKLPDAPTEPPPWWKDTRENSLMWCRQSGYHFFEEGPLSRRIAAYPGAGSEQEARDRFARENPQYIIPF